MKIVIAILSSVILAVLSGCASVGVNYQYESISKLKINEFKIEDVNAVFGKPFKTEKRITKEGNIDLFRFEYIFVDIFTVRKRVLVLEFKNGVLNSYAFNSSFDADRTLFNRDKIDQVKIGASTYADAINILGEPHGKANCPSILDDYKKRCENASTVWTWMYQGKYVVIAHKDLGAFDLFLSFSPNGKVSNIEVFSRNFD